MSMLKIEIQIQISSSNASRRFGRMSGSFLLHGRKTTPETVLGDDARHEKVLEVFAAARLGSTAAHPESAERLTFHDRAGDGPIDIKISANHFVFHALDVRRA